MRYLLLFACALFVSACATTHAPPAEKYVNDVLPKGAYAERYVSANTIELERIDFDLPCKHFGAGYYFPGEDYVALVLIDKVALSYYYPDITSGVVLNPRIFVSALSGSEAVEIGKHCAITIYQPKKEIA